MSVWIAFCEGRLCVCVFPLFFFRCTRITRGPTHYALFRRHSALLVGPVHCSRDPQPLYLEKNIKNEFHGTIHTFKNYFLQCF